MTTAVLTDRLSSKATSVADGALEAAARLWFLTAVTGQLVFVFAVASFYASAAVRGNFQAWNRFMPQGHVAGDGLGNTIVGIHLLAAVFIVVSGAIQLLPWIRRVAPALHRWNGRLYILSAFTVSPAGLYMLWGRASALGLAAKVGNSLDGLLIMGCAAMALRTAMVRDFQTHRRWALRLFLVVGGVWFFRVTLALSFLIFKGPFGFDPTTFQGPFLSVLSYGSYLLPLAVLELYLRAQDGWRARGRLAVAALLLVLTVAMGMGIFAATMAFWLPRVRAAYDSRKSIATTLSPTIVSRGVEQAVAQYHALATTEPAAYNFDERELNTLGYALIREKRLDDAIRIFRLNAEAYPRSSNAYDSLGEAYLDHGDKTEAIAHYRKALALDPSRRSAAEALRKLGAP
jgi:Predicted membrane protein (DUF2306)/Tetratricopeptide repeat